jgi:orotate phosphoribosyltransferase
MQLIPTRDEIISLFRKSGALRDGHFEYPNGLHTNQHVETALVMRSYQNAKVLSIALSRLVRANSELRAWLPELSIVTVTAAGLPVAYGLAEALRPKQVYWAEKIDPLRPMHLEITPSPGERIILVDDILRSGILLAEAKALLESYGASVVALAVLIHQPIPGTLDLAPLPTYSLARIEGRHFDRAADCDLCGRGVPLERVGTKWESEDIPEAAVCTAS